MSKMHLTFAALALALGAQTATAAPVAGGAGLGAPAAQIEQARWMRPHRECRVEIVRRRTPRGMVVTKVRRCR
jgi:hypothetical protein